MSQIEGWIANQHTFAENLEHARKICDQICTRAVEKYPYDLELGINTSALNIALRQLDAPSEERVRLEARLEAMENAINISLWCTDLLQITKELRKRHAALKSTLAGADDFHVARGHGTVAGTDILLVAPAPLERVRLLALAKKWREDTIQWGVVKGKNECADELEAVLAGADASAQHCHAGSDGDCSWKECPQEANNRANYQKVCPLLGAPKGDTND